MHKQTSLKSIWVQLTIREKIRPAWKLELLGMTTSQEQWQNHSIWFKVSPTILETLDHGLQKDTRNVEMVILVAEKDQRPCITNENRDQALLTIKNASERVLQSFRIMVRSVLMIDRNQRIKMIILLLQSFPRMATVPNLALKMKWQTRRD